MYVLLTSLIVFAAIVLILLVLAQNSKGGGLASGFSTTNQVMGVRQATDFVEKATWGFATGIIVLSIAASIVVSTTKVSSVQESAISTEIEALPFNIDQNLNLEE